MVMPYRADESVLQSRCETLERELEELRARSRELGEIQREEARVARDLEAARKMLRDRRVLPLLEDVRVASPCKADWAAMTGDEQVRFCGQCEKNVYNLSAMTREAGERLLFEKEGKVCVRFYQRADGTVMTSDCPVGVRRRRVRRVAVATVGGGLVAAAAAGLGAMSMGKVATYQGAVAMDSTIATHRVVMGEPGPATSAVPTPPAPHPPTMGHVLMGRPAITPGGRGHFNPTGKGQAVPSTR
jgi:hypothetical protein